MKNTLLKRFLSVFLSFALMAGLFVPMANVKAIAAKPLDKVESDGKAIETEIEGLKLSKKLSEDGKKITLEAYSTGAVRTENKSVPLDIVLVLDTSGSMEEIIKTDYVFVTDKKSELNKKKTYYVKRGNEYEEIEHRKAHFFHGKHWYTSDGVEIENDEKFYKFVETSRLDALKLSVNAFIESVAAKAKKDNVDHKIAIVEFASDAETLNDLTSAKNNKEDLKNSISALTPNGATEVDDGLENAKDILKKVPADRKSNKVVLVFTDGKPTTTNTFDPTVAKEAIEDATDLKEMGATIYTIGMFGTEDANINKFMSLVSSNYGPFEYGVKKVWHDGNWWSDGYYEDVPRAWNELPDSVKETSTDFYKLAKDGADLSNIFQEISNIITEPTIDLGKETVIKDIMSKNFKLPDNTDIKDIKTFTVDAKADGSFEETQNPVDIDIVLDKKGNDVVSVKGFDFNENTVTSEPKSDGTYGKKLIIEIPVEYIENSVKTDGKVFSNDINSGIYPKGAKDPILKFGRPEATITKPKYTVTWKDADGKVLETDKNVYYGTEPEYNSSKPTKSADVEYTYEFNGWSPKVVEVTGNAEYTATYKATKNKYDVIWQDWNNDKLKAEKVEYGETPEYGKPNPTRESTAEFDYEFKGWSPEIKPVDEKGAVYTAQYNEIRRNYTVKWINWNDELLEKDENVPYGEMPQFNETKTPLKEGDNQYSYIFLGWNKVGGVATGEKPTGVETVTGDVTYKAVYKEYTNKYDVIWKNHDDTVLETDENVPYGTTPEYNGPTPTKPADAQYTYTHSGWTPSVSMVTGNITYTATFSKTVNNYTVWWINGSDIIETDKNVSYGTTPSYDGETPVKAADAQYTYTFKGWDPKPSMVTGDITYKAQFDKTERSYTVKWLSEDGNTTLETDTVKYGVKPTFKGDEPTKNSTQEFTYNFAGWNPEVVKVIGDAEYKATFTATTNKYTVTYTDGVADATVFADKKITVKYGTVTPKFSDDDKAPTREHYIFLKWSPEVADTVKDNVTYTAIWVEDKNDNGKADEDEFYTIRYLDGKTVLYSDEIKVFNATPKIADPEKDGYVFDKWNPEVADTVTKDADYVAQWNQDENGNKEPDKDEFFTVTWLDENGTTVLKTDEHVQYGTMPSYNGETPTKPNTDEFTYAFAGWSSPEGQSSVMQPVKTDVKFIATYTNTTNAYDVTWKNYDGTVLKTDKDIKYGIVPSYNGDTPTKPADAQYTYTFAGWNPEISKVTGDITYTAQFDAKINQYTVTWLDEDGTTLKTDTLDYGATPSYGKAPTKAPTAKYTYTFKDWTPTVVEVTGNAEYKAQYTATVNQYTVTYADGVDGEDLFENNKFTEDYGTKTPEFTAPDRHNYVFVEWDKTIADTVTEDVTYTAVWAEDKNNNDIADDKEFYDITYTDGVEDEAVFEDVTTSVKVFEKTPAFDGKPVRHNYVFTGWNPEVADIVTGKATYVATWAEDKNNNGIADDKEFYDITYTDGVEDEVVFEDVTTSVKVFEKTPAFDGKPVRHNYVFTGWNPEVAETVEKASVYVATWADDKNNNDIADDKEFYDITYTDGVEDEVVFEDVTASVKVFENTPAFGEDPTRENYIFMGWTPTVAKTVTGDATYTAVWVEDKNNNGKADANEFYDIIYTDGVEDEVVFEDVKASVKVFEKTPSFGDAPTRLNYIFVKWNPEVAETVEKAAVYVAEWAEDKNNNGIADDKEFYDITYTDGVEDEVVFEDVTASVKVFDKTPAFDEEPKRPDYVFVGWEPEVADIVTEAKTYKATWADDKNNNGIPDDQEVIIDDETPLAPIDPPVEEPAEKPAEPEQVVIEDETPLANAPHTNDATDIVSAVAGVAVTGAACLFVMKKRKEEE